MTTDKLEIVRGSGNVFRDLGHENADAEQLKAILAAEIVKRLDRDKLTVRQAKALTGIDAGDFSRVRNADLGRFTIDRLMLMVSRLGVRLEVAVKAHRATAPARAKRSSGSAPKKAAPARGSHASKSRAARSPVLRPM